MRIVVCIDLSGKEPNRQMVTSGNLSGVMVSTLAQKARGVGLIPT